MRTLGVDPGATGALVLLDLPMSGRGARLTVHDMPTAKQKVGGRQKSVILEAVLAALVRELAPDQAYLEDVHSMPGQGVVSTFTFGTGFGIARGVLAGVGVPATLVSPQVWGRLVGLPRGDGGSRIRASQLFPAYASQLQRHDRADAALIAFAGHRLASPF